MWVWLEMHAMLAKVLMQNLDADKQFYVYLTQFKHNESHLYYRRRRNNYFKHSI